MKRPWYPLLQCAVLGAAAALSFGAERWPGLGGWAAGALIGGGLAWAGSNLTARVRTAAGRAVLAALYASIALSFLTIIAALFVVQWLAPALVGPVVLTALAVYLAHRFHDALSAWPGGPRNAGTDKT